MLLWPALGFGEAMECFVYFSKGGIDLGRTCLALRLQGGNRRQQRFGIATVDFCRQALQLAGLGAHVFRALLAWPRVPKRSKGGVKGIDILGEGMRVPFVLVFGNGAAGQHCGDSRRDHVRIALGHRNPVEVEVAFGDDVSRRH